MRFMLILPMDINMTNMCSALTKKDNVCMNKGKYKNGCNYYCGIHAEHIKVRCCAFTCKGHPCLNPGTYEKYNNNYCTFHINMKECPICINLIPKSEETVTKCNHVYQIKCIQIWSSKNDTCPMCRCPLTKMSLPLASVNFLSYIRMVRGLLPHQVSEGSILMLRHFYDEHTEMCDTIYTTPMIWKQRFLY
jgi:hypothetical protein